VSHERTGPQKKGLSNAKHMSDARVLGRVCLRNMYSVYSCILYNRLSLYVAYRILQQVLICYVF